jgi:hypothetical protein
MKWTPEERLEVIKTINAEISSDLFVVTRSTLERTINEVLDMSELVDYLTYQNAAFLNDPEIIVCLEKYLPKKIGG